MKQTFRGYLRNDGSAGTRNHIGIISTVICSSVVTNEIADKVPGSIPIVHANGCAQLGDDFKVTRNMLSGVAENPNIYGALLVGLGCETNQVGGMLNNITKTKPLEGFGIQQMAGGKNTVNKGVSITKKWLKEIAKEERSELPLSLLKIGIITEDVDKKSLKTFNPIIKDLINLLVKNGATVVFGLTNTLEPAGSLIAKKTNNLKLKDYLIHAGKGLNRRRWNEVKKYERIKYSTEDKEKAKLEAGLIGENEIKSFLNYNEKPKNSGLHLIKSSGSIVETLSNFAAVGCNISLTLSKREVLTSSNVLPCLTLIPAEGNGIANDFVDYEVTQENVDKQVELLFDKIILTSSGDLTKLEEYELGEFAIPHIGTTF